MERSLQVMRALEIPVDDMDRALRMEKETVERSVRYCRDLLGIKKEKTD